MVPKRKLSHRLIFEASENEKVFESMTQEQQQIDDDDEMEVEISMISANYSFNLLTEIPTILNPLNLLIILLSHNGLTEFDSLVTCINAVEIDVSYNCITGVPGCDVDDDSSAGVLAHRQDPAGCNIGILQKIERNEAIVVGCLGVVKNFLELFKMSRSQILASLGNIAFLYPGRTEAPLQLII